MFHNYHFRFNKSTQAFLHNFHNFGRLHCKFAFVSLNGCHIREAIEIKMKEKQTVSWKLFAKSWLEGLGLGGKFVFANSFPITRHTMEFVSRLYRVNLSTMAMKKKLGDTKRQISKQWELFFSKYIINVANLVELVKLYFNF